MLKNEIRQARRILRLLVAVQRDCQEMIRALEEATRDGQPNQFDWEFVTNDTDVAIDDLHTVLSIIKNCSLENPS